VAGKRFPSVLEKLSQARQPGLKVFHAKSGNGTPIATIVYFDRATVPEQMIASVHCTEKGLRQLAEWRLELVDENWKGIVFNFGTDCS
jgi:hypothetical protein